MGNASNNHLHFWAKYFLSKVNEYSWLTCCNCQNNIRYLSFNTVHNRMKVQWYSSNHYLSEIWGRQGQVLPTTMGPRTGVINHNGTQDRCYQPQWDPGQVLPATMGTQDWCYQPQWDPGQVLPTIIGTRTGVTNHSGTMTGATNHVWTQDRCYQPQWDPEQVLPTTMEL